MSIDEIPSTMPAETAGRIQPSAADRLPARMRLLWISPRQPDWVALALRLDAAGCTEPRFQWALDGRTALAQLRRETYDALIVSPDVASGDGSWDDPPALLGAIRAAGHDGPLLLVAPRLDDRDWLHVAELDAEILVTPLAAESPALVGMVQRAVTQSVRRAELQRLAGLFEQRLIRERDEAQRLLIEQQEMLGKLERLAEDVGREASLAASVLLDPSRPDAHAEWGMRNAECPGEAFRPRESAAVPEQFASCYEELLRAHVMMGVGGLDREVAQLAHALAELRVSPRQTMALHLRQVERVAESLGGRSRRHVLDRADLLILELMTCLGTEYFRAAGT